MSVISAMSDFQRVTVKSRARPRYPRYYFTTMSKPTGFGRLLRELRGSMKQEDLALKLQCSRSLVANVETGLSRPSQDFLTRLTAVFPEHEAALLQAYNTLPRRTKRSGYKFSDPDRVAQGRFNLLLRKNRVIEAKAGMEFALKSNPQPIQRLWLLRRLAEVALQYGDLALGLARYREAIAVSIEESLPGWESSLRIALAHYLITFPGEIAEAHAVLDEGLSRNVEQGGLWQCKGNAYWHEHDYPAAYACMMTAEAHGLRVGEIDYSRGHVLAEWGHYGAAIADLTHALNRRMSARDHAYARVARAYAYGQLGDLDLAVSEFATAEEVTPDNGWLFYYRALCYLTHGQNGLALKDLQTAVTSPTGLNDVKRERALELIAELEAEPRAS